MSVALCRAATHACTHARSLEDASSQATLKMQVEEAPKKQAVGDAAKTKQEQEVRRPHSSARVRSASSHGWQLVAASALPAVARHWAGRVHIEVFPHPGCAAHPAGARLSMDGTLSVTPYCAASRRAAD